MDTSPEDAPVRSGNAFVSVKLNTAFGEYQAFTGYGWRENVQRETLVERFGPDAGFVSREFIFPHAHP